MKKNTSLLVILFSLFYTVNIFSQAVWTPQTSGTTKQLNAIYFINENTGWAAGYGGIIIKTTNGGTNWFVLQLQATREYTAIHFFDESNGYMSEMYGHICKTTNGGTNWTEFQVTSNPLNALYCVSMFDLWSCGDYGYIYHSTNSGTNWVTINTGLFTKLTSIMFVAGVGRAGAWGGQNLLSTNGGANWTTENLNTSANVTSLYFTSLTTGIAVGSNGMVSRLNGASWVTTYPFNNSDMNSLFMLNINTGWCVGSTGLIEFSSNNGANWTQQAAIGQNIKSIFFINSQTGWVCGSTGLIRKTTNGGTLFIQQIGNEIPSSFSLKQNYPNPFNPVTKIKFDIPTPHLYKGGQGGVSLKIYDILGKEITTLVNQKLQPGSYEVTFDGINLPSGVYFYQLRTGDFTDTKSMVLIK